MRLTVAELACERGGREVFAGISFAVEGGEALLVSGRNGAGKSSLLRVLAGLIRPAAGRLSLEGGDPELSIAEQAHYLGHQDAQKGALSVAENLRFWTGFFGRGGDTAGALAAVGLGGLAGLPAATLSAGQRRRLSIARLIAAPRPIWLLDEPTSTLDRGAQDRLAALMATHLAGGGLIVAASHGPIGLPAVKELRLDPSASSPLDETPLGLAGAAR
ncbi:MAG TPA: heme ABC exporter ATP-binding protein CcmA [Xanthobacteraceae bacterium]|nr:heme ABC exporter ATP-binding protein CcmA [Xanthobacteraceae bacterium]